MNLLIVGAGGHGEVIKEIAEDIGYDKIAFIDDFSTKAIGKICDIVKFKDYENAVCSIGNNKLRGQIIEKLKQEGFKIPVLIHPRAFASKSAIIEEGTVVEPEAIVNANAVIGKGCIISLGTIVDHDALVSDYAHINSGSVVEAGAYVDKYEKVSAGSVKER